MDYTVVGKPLWDVTIPEATYVTVFAISIGLLIWAIGMLLSSKGPPDAL